MKVQLDEIAPQRIEKRSFEIITEELGDFPLIPGTEDIVKRCIHTSADFDYAKNLAFSQDAVEHAQKAIKKGACIEQPLTFAIGNAPTALGRLYEMIREGRLKPELVIGVPVGFVNVVQAKELIMETEVPYIVARGRKGGSNIAACICNALLYMLE